MSSIRALIGILAMLVSAPSAPAALSVAIADSNGDPVSDAVVTLRPAAGAGAERKAPASHIVDQKDETFLPYVEVAHPGDRVVFRNSDITRHHVYSFSPVKAFEFVLAPGESSQPLVLERTGVVAIGCNIHDHMIAYLYVTDAALAARSDGGRVAFGGVAPGDWSVQVWHPQQRSQLPTQNVRLAATDTRALSFSLHLLPDPRQSQDRERSGY